MQRKSFSRSRLLRGSGAGFLLIAVLLTLVQFLRFTHQQPVFPNGSLIAGVPVGGLDRTAAKDRLSQVILAPVELHYQDAIILAAPTDLGLTIDMDALLDSASQSLPSFWQRLWNQTPGSPANVPLNASVSAETLRAYLQNQVAARYDQPPQPPVPVPASPQYLPGSGGWTLDIEAAVTQITALLTAAPGASRSLDLPVTVTDEPHPLLQNLQIQLEQILDASGFDGLAEIYVQDLKTKDVVHFARQNQQDITPGVAFTAASTIKVPIMVSVLSRMEEPISQDVLDLFTAMVVKSENPPADTLMDTYLGGNLGPLEVTKDMQALGLKSTFIAGYFYFGAPLLIAYDTPANTRTDINLQPDTYNQTTPADIGVLLADIYTCAKDGSGPLVDTLKMTQNKCQIIVDVLSSNRNGVLLEAGLPESVQIAHKHGWVNEADGLLHNLSDVAIVYSTGGDYIITMYLYRTDQLLFDEANIWMGTLSQAVYNYFNPPQTPKP